MFNAHNWTTGDQPAMRAIIKKPQSSVTVTVDSFTSSHCNDTLSFPSVQAAQVAVNVDNKLTVLGYDSYYVGNVVNCAILSNQYIHLVNTLAARARQRSLCYDTKRVFKINENAVRLDDIEEWWYSDNETVTLRATRQRKEYDDIDLDYFAIHREAQEYNDCGDLQQKLDFFFLQSVLQHIVLYLRESWFELTHSQRLVLCLITSHNPYFSIFDHFLWFGYDCLIRSHSEEFPIKAAEYNKIVKNALGILSQKLKKDANDLVIDFGTSFSYCNAVIATCNKHFDKSRRRRMPYTRNFFKNQ